MANEYPFIPYPFSEPVAPEPVSPVQPVVSPFSSPPVFSPRPSRSEATSSMRPEGATFPAAQAFSPPTTEEKPPFSESPSAFSEADDEEDEAAKKTALAIVAGVLVVLLLVGFGIWYFLRDESGEIFPDPNLIVAAIGGKILTPEDASLLIPPGALSEDTKIEISKVSDGNVTDLFELKPLGVKFLKPVTVEIPYKKSGPIILEYWREEDGKKRALRHTMDKEEKKLRTQLKEF